MSKEYEKLDNFSESIYNVSEEAYQNLAIEMIRQMSEDYKRAYKRKDIKECKKLLNEIKTSSYTNYLVSDTQYIIDEIQRQYGKITDLEEKKNG